MKKTLFKTLIAITVTILYFVSAMMETGGGHGNFYVFAPILPPWIWLSLIISFLFTDYLDKKIPQVIYLCLMLIHYVGLFYGLYTYQFEKDAGWSGGHIAIATPILYLAIQIAVCYHFWRKMNKGSLG